MFKEGSVQDEVARAEHRIKCHPALFRKSCLSLCTRINLVGQHITMGVDGLTLFIALLYFPNTIKPWLLPSTHLKCIYLHRVLFSLELLFYSIVLPIWSVLQLCLVAVIWWGWDFVLVWHFSFETSHWDLNWSCFRTEHLDVILTFFTSVVRVTTI